jgi:hypothetical protein
MNRPWQPGAVTGIGALPGTDPDEAARLVFGELAGFAHLVELPARGAGADLIGRSAALLVDLPVEIVPSGWRFAAHPGHDARHARDLLQRDLDAMQANAAGYAGPFKLQAAGPWTLAASLELPSGHRVVSDRGAVRDLTESLTEGLRLHLDDVARRLPGVHPVLQLDEPSVPAVLAGQVPTPSGYGTVRAVDAPTVAQALGAVLAVADPGARAVHCCAADAPIALLRAAGADSLALDASLLTSAHYDALGEAVEAGTSLWLGVLPTSEQPLDLDTARDPIRRLWGRLGFAPDLLAGSLVATPACGLAGASPAHARRVLSVLREVGNWLADAAAEGTLG